VIESPPELMRPDSGAAPRRDEGRFAAVTSHLWFRFIVRRLIGLVGVLVALAVGLFWLIQLVPGDPVTNSLGSSGDPVVIERLRHENGFDRPLLEQFTEHMTKLVHGDLGRSLLDEQPVGDLITQRIGSSLELAGAGLAIVILFSVPIGMLAAAGTREGRHRKLEVLFTGTTSTLGALPELLTATVLAFLLAVQFRVFPVAGSGSLSQLVLPALAISLGPLMHLARIVRVETLNVLAQDYMRTARMKRLTSARIFFRHALPNVLTAVLTIAGLLFAGLMGGAVIVENIFARPGLGTALVKAVEGKDFTVVQGIVLVIGATLVIINALVDVLLATLDPRSLTRHA
jgi:peptide/nickel transport system permease protein